jgi:hypothetical protein
MRAGGLSMPDWTKVVTEPLGLAGFALFLAFGALSRLKQEEDRRWLRPMASLMAVLALVGGLTLAYVKSAQSAAPVVTSAPVTQAPATAPQKPAQSQTNQVEQTTTGAGSPAVQGVQGDVTITVDQSSGTYKKPIQPPKSSAKPAK